MNRKEIVTIGKKFDEVNDSFDNLLWFINHCNVPFTNEYLFSAGFLSQQTDGGIIYTIICAYKDIVINFKEFNIMAIPSRKEQGEQQAKTAAYYHLMNQFLLWTGPKECSDFMIKIREENGYAPLISNQQQCLSIVNKSLDEIRTQNARTHLY